MALKISSPKFPRKLYLLSLSRKRQIISSSPSPMTNNGTTLISLTNFFVDSPWQTNWLLISALLPHNQGSSFWSPGFPATRPVQSQTPDVGKSRKKSNQQSLIDAHQRKIRRTTNTQSAGSAVRKLVPRFPESRDWRPRAVRSGMAACECVCVPSFPEKASHIIHPCDAFWLSTDMMMQCLPYFNMNFSLLSFLVTASDWLIPISLFSLFNGTFRWLGISISRKFHPKKGQPPASVRWAKLNFYYLSQ